MSEPKKETVRIVLPPQDGTPVAGNPREKAMAGGLPTNLPVKPVPAPPSGSSLPKPPGSPVVPGGIPKPPAPPVGATIPKPPGAPTPPVAPAASRPAGAPKIEPSFTPQPIKPEPKKETAKVAVGATVKLPQATVKLNKGPAAPLGSSSAKVSITTAQAPQESSATAELSPVLGAVALVAALFALGVQLWMMI